jgi:hypothetical protein
VGWNISPAQPLFFFGLEHQPSPRGWAESSPVFCKLEHQPSPRGWAESSLVAGPIQAQPSPFHFISFLLFVFCFFYIYFKKKIVIFSPIFLRHFN